MRIDFTEDAPAIGTAHWLKIARRWRYRGPNPNLGEPAKRVEPAALTEEGERRAIWASMLQRVADRLVAERIERELAQRKVALEKVRKGAK